ncbi:golgin candidate 1-like [Macadamia integrifolia]|uniref:golgin candidate 1-like n=1 Tax=Macadamia integrifolia TaxID=60698 RepID=UPI001C4F1795|nr:golgin candidate 1-like [Macadamia integrifolia]
MSSWLKVAEDLLEVVDRRAKSVVGELSEEQSDSQPSASNGRGSQARKTKSRKKAQKILSSNEPIKTRDTAHDQPSIQELVSNVSNDHEKEVLPSENVGTMSTSSTAQTSKQLQLDVNKDNAPSGISLPETPPNGEGKHEANHMIEVPSTFTDVEPVTSSTSGELAVENKSEGHEDSSSVLSTASGVEALDRDLAADSGQTIRLPDEDIPVKIDQEKSEPETVETHSNIDTQMKDVDVKELVSEPKKQQEHKSDSSPIKVQDQLDEAQGLLKSAISTGQSKEARLARVCAGLSSRLQEYKSENAQLEELLITERERSSSYEAQIRQLHQELSISKVEVTRVESNIAEALAAKNSEIEALVNSMEAFKKQAAVSEGKLASLQADLDYVMRNRELTETRMIQALREEVSSAERRAEEERAAHNATKKAAMEREVELEHRAVEASTALARIQRTVDERTARAAELERKLVLLEVECASLNQELQDMEARARREQKRSPEEANQALQIQAWQEEVERARQGQRDAESKLFSLEAEVQKMRVEMAGMKRDAEHYSRQEHMELEKRYRELTDLLYYKQTQLETMASEKAAAEFQLEKEIKRLHEAQVEAERSRVSRRASSTWEEDTDLKALEPLPLYHRHMVGASIQLQKAAKLLDSGAVRATKFLWRYPVARVILLFYLVFVHLFLMYLLHRLQEQADSFNPGDAEFMGLNNHTLP